MPNNLNKNKMLPIILIIYSIIDISAIIFLFLQYKILLNSDDYKNDSLINKFIVGFLALGGLIFVLGLLLTTVYYIFI